jgi:hypothetical protein
MQTHKKQLLKKAGTQKKQHKKSKSADKMGINKNKFNFSQIF